MNINQIRYFVAAVEHGSFSAAGSALYVTSQAVSKAISEMEKDTGIKMLERTGNGVHPTEFGNIFYRKALELVRSFSELESLAEDFSVQGEVAGSMSLSMTIPFFRGSVPIESNFNRFTEQHPSSKLTVFVNTSSACMQALEEGTVDAAVTLGRSDNPLLACYKIAEVQPQLLVPVNHPLANHKEASFRDLAGTPILSPTDLSFFYKTLLARCREYGFEPDFVTLPPILDEFKAFLHNSNGIMFVTKDSQLSELYPNTVCIPLAKQDSFKIPLCLLCKKERKTPLFLALKDYLIKNARSFYE